VLLVRRHQPIYGQQLPARRTQPNCRTKKEGEIMKIQWSEDIDAALSDAKREHKHVLLDFHNPL